MCVESNKYQTSNINFSAFLISNGFDLQRLEVIKRKVVFIFNLNQEDVESNKKLFFSDVGTVKALSYSKEIKSLKDKTFKALNGDVWVRH